MPVPSIPQDIVLAQLSATELNQIADQAALAFQVRDPVSYLSVVSGVLAGLTVVLAPLAGLIVYSNYRNHKMNCLWMRHALRTFARLQAQSGQTDPVRFQFAMRSGSLRVCICARAGSPTNDVIPQWLRIMNDYDHRRRARGGLIPLEPLPQAEENPYEIEQASVMARAAHQIGFARSMRTRPLPPIPPDEQPIYVNLPAPEPLYESLPAPLTS